MNEEEPKIQKEIAERLREHLARIPNIKTVSMRRNMRIAGSQVDVDSVVEVGNSQYEILVEVKSDGSPSVIRRAASQLKSLRQAFPKDANFYLAIGAPYISDEGMEVCREEEVGCLDTVGNCYLSFSGIHIEIRGNKDPQPAKRSSKFLFSPKSSRVIRVLLSNTNRWWQVQEIAGEAKISIGLVSRLKQKLLEEEFALEQERRLRVKSPKRLTDAWVETYRYKRNPSKEYYSLDNGQKVEQRIAEYCGQQKIRYALGMFSAASRIAPHVRMNKAFVFVDASLDEVASALQFKSVPSGSNVVLLKPYDAGVFYKSRDIDGLNVVSDVQIYIDLKTYKGRGEEAAEFLMQHSLEPSWRQSQNMVNVR
jgi:AraC-like DNA-binding protein